MKIAIIGSGSIGGTLGSILASKGHQITFGVRDIQSDKIKVLLESISGNVKADSIPSATAQSEVVILATPWAAAQDAIANAGDLNGKILIDCINPIEMTKDGLSRGLIIGHTTSAAEEIASWAKGALVVKAFNNIGANCFNNLQFDSITANAFICGDDSHAKQIAKSIAEDIGFEVIDVGALKQARLLEPLGMLWINLAISGMDREFSISLLKR